MSSLNEALAGELTASGGHDMYAGTDWNPALQDANGWFNRLVNALRMNDRGQRLREFGRIESELQTLRQANTRKGD